MKCDTNYCVTHEIVGTLVPFSSCCYVTQSAWRKLAPNIHETPTLHTSSLLKQDKLKLMINFGLELPFLILVSPNMMLGNHLTTGTVTMQQSHFNPHLPREGRVTHPL